MLRWVGPTIQEMLQPDVLAIATQYHDSHKSDENKSNSLRPKRENESMGINRKNGERQRERE